MKQVEGEGQQRGITQAGKCAIELSTRRQHLLLVGNTLGKCCVQFEGRGTKALGVRTASDMQSACRPCDSLGDRALIFKCRETLLRATELGAESDTPGRRSLTDLRTARDRSPAHASSQVSGCPGKLSEVVRRQPLSGARKACSWRPSVL